MEHVAGEIEFNVVEKKKRERGFSFISQTVEITDMNEGLMCWQSLLREERRCLYDVSDLFKDELTLIGSLQIRNANIIIRLGAN